MAKRPPNDQLEFSDFNAAWLNTPSPFNSLDKDWLKIIVFFVFHIPVQGVSARGTSLSAFHWGEKSNNNDYKILKARLITFSGIEEEQFKPVEKWEDMRRELSDNDLIAFPQNINNVRLTFRKDKNGICESLCNHIRNSFAHGRLAFYNNEGETFIVMEDIDKQMTVTARMILTKTILLRWIEVIRSGPFLTNNELNELFGISNH